MALGLAACEGPRHLKLGLYSTSASPSLRMVARPRLVTSLPMTGSSTASMSSGRFSSSSGCPASMQLTTCARARRQAGRRTQHAGRVGRLAGPRDLLNVARLRLLHDDQAVGLLAADDPLDALQLRVDEQAPAAGRGHDGAILHAQRVCLQALLRPARLRTRARGAQAAGF